MGKAGDDGWEDVSDEGWSHVLGGTVNTQLVMYAAQNAGSRAKVADAENYFEFRNVRLSVAGKGYGVYDYMLQLEFEPENGGNEAVMLRNAYFGIHELPILGYLRFGNMRAPFNLEDVTIINYTTFLERSLPNVFSPRWRSGVAAFNRSPGGNVTWTYGAFYDAFNQMTKQVENDNQGVRAIARATYTPYYDEPSGGRYLIHTGIGYQFVDDDDDLVAFAARPEVHENGIWIRTNPVAADHYNVLGLESAIVWGPFSVQSEYMYVPVDGFDFRSGYVYGSWFLTGESRAYKRSAAAFTRQKPFTNFWIVRGAGIGTGAVELATRWSYLDLSGTGHANGGMQNDLTVGLNWYWNPNVRWAFNYIRSWTEYDNGNPTAENDILGIRGQVEF